MKTSMQHAFRCALDEPRSATPELHAAIRGRCPAARIAVYRNNAFSARSATIRAAFPAVERLLGEEYFGALGNEFIRQHPPCSPVLHEYGCEFADFIDRFPPLQGFPYLGDLARLEWARRTAFHAANASLPVFDQGSSAALLSLVGQRLGWHPSLQLLHSVHPVLRLWQSQMGDEPVQCLAEWHPSSLLVWRRGWRVETQSIDPLAQRLLECFESPGEFIAAARTVPHTQSQLATDFATLLRLGLLVAVAELQSTCSMRTHHDATA